MAILWRLIRTELRPYARGLAVRTLIAMVVAAAPYAFSFLGKWLVDDVLQVTGPPKIEQAATPEQGATPAKPPMKIEWTAKTAPEKLRLLIGFLAVSVAIHIAITGFSYLSELLNARMVQHLVYKLRTSLHDRVGQLDMAFFARQQVGELMTRVLDDVAVVPASIMNLVVNSCTQVVMVVVGLFLLLKLNVTMTLVALIALPVYAFVCGAFLPKIQRNANDLRIRIAKLNGFIVERLANVLTVKNYAQEDREVDRFGTIVDQNIALSRKQYTLSLVFGTLTTVITGVATLAVLAFGFLNIKRGTMQLGEVLAFYQITAQLFVPISALVSMTTVAATQRVLASRIYGILDAETTVQEPSEPVSLPQIRGGVSFEGVSLRYEEGGPFAVEDVKLRIPAGTTACLVGPTGSGKTTLLMLLSRLYDPTEGRVRIDGVDIRDLRISDLRRSVRNVLYEPHVFSGTFAENIVYGAPDATRSEIEAAAKLVLLHDSIQAQPEGYETRIGPGGLVLSNADLTKLALARALVTRPVILTVDDTYSALDEQSEQQIRRAIRDALPDCTILIASSRLSICQDADMIVVMRDGRVLQTGTHEELLATPATYRRMFMREMGIEAVERVGSRRQPE